MYSLTIVPDITDLVGNAMDQDADGTPGEVPDDRFAASINLVPAPPFEAHFDFRTAISPVAAGYDQITHTTTYSRGEGFGWLSGSVDSRDRGSSTGDDMTRDFNFTESAAFVVDVPNNGVYEVTLTMGDGLGYTRDEMGVFLEGTQLDSGTCSS